MNILRRKLPDGRPAHGVLVYALIFGVPAVLLFFVLKGERIANEVRGRGVEISRLSQAVQTGEAVVEPKSTPAFPSTRAITGAAELTEAAEKTASAKEAPPPGPPPANALDAAVDEANRAVDKDRPELPPPGGLPGSVRERGSNSAVMPITPGDTETSPLRAGLGGVTAGIAGNQVSGTVADLVAYRRAPARPGTETASARPATAVVADKYAPGTFLPRGFYIELYLLDTVRTDQAQPIVTFGVAKDVVFGRKVFLPFGTRLLATVSGNPDKGTRVQVNPSSFQFPDGSELGVAGAIKGLDNAAGIPAYYIPPPTWVQLSGYVNDFLTGYLNLLYLRQQQASNLTIGSVSVGTATPVFDYKSQALATTSNVIQDFAKKQMEELQSRFAPYLTVPAGTKVLMQLTAPLTLTDRGVNTAQLKAVPDAKSVAQEGLGVADQGLAAGSPGSAALTGLATAISNANRGQ